jgi:2-octaprenyl-3-methyl-6-methoxy-1,4-benzoquinol hydroxylase/2-octaprenylphenol hydroxylase
MTRRSLHDVAIVGAGMVGAALALALAKEGFDVALVESRAPAPWRAEDDVDPRVVALAASSIEFFGRLDVWTAIAELRASAYRRMHVWDALAPGDLSFDAADQGASTLGYIVENRLIQAVLWQVIEASPAITLRVPAEVVSTDIDDDRRILVFADDSRLAAKLIVAADGANSALREMAGIHTRDRDYAQRAVVAHVTHERPHRATAWQRFLPRATLAFLPLADGRSSIVWSVPNAECERLLALDDAAFCAELGGALDFQLGAILSTSRRSAFPLHMKLAERYIAKRFAVVGDAAHVVHPLAGQGVNLGLRDVDELVAALVAARDAKRDFASEYTLRKFERRRRSDNALSAYAFDAISRIFGSESAPLAVLRGAGLGIVDRIAPLKQLFARHAAGR